MTRRINGVEELGIYVPGMDRYFMGPDHCAKVLGVNISTVYRALKGARKTAAGFKLEWAVPDTPAEGE